MAEAKRPGGLYFMGDDAVDANGNKLESAPKKQADTPREKQPGSIGVADPEARLAKAMVSELVGAGVIKGKRESAEAGEEVRPRGVPEPPQGATVNRPSAADRAPGASDSTAQTAIATAEAGAQADSGSTSGASKEGSETSSARKGSARKSSTRKSARKSAGK